MPTLKKVNVPNGITCTKCKGNVEGIGIKDTRVKNLTLYYHTSCSIPVVPKKLKTQKQSRWKYEKLCLQSQ